MPTSQEIYAKAREYELYTAENLGKLVRAKSLSMQEKDVCDVLRGLMEEAGFDEVKTDGIGNVIGRVGSGKKVIAIDAHIDTVDIGNRANWTFDPLSGAIEGGFVLGRGTVDQKGGASAFITAGRIVKELGLCKDVTLLFTGTVMEEDCDGLCWNYLINEVGIKPDFVIITEPTNLGIYRGHRGRMEIRLEFDGVSSHGSAPERGKNAIYMAGRAALNIEMLNEKLAFDPFLGKGTVAVTEFLSTTPSLCAVSDYARLHLDRRLTWGETRELALSQASEIAGGEGGRAEILQYVGKAYTGKEYGMEKYYPTWKLEENNPLVATAAKSYSELFNEKPVIDKWTFSTNAVTIMGIHGIPCIGFGPGNEVLAHAPDEKTPIDHLTKAAAFYANFCNHF